LIPPAGMEIFAADMTATLSADVLLNEVQQKLAQLDQWLPVDADAPAATVGELVDRNSTGPLRLGYGAWRDLLLGCQFTNGRGQLITAGGRAVKNVAGYDLTKFMVGQHGVFGKLETVTTRTYRRPQWAMTAIFAPDARLFHALLATPCRPQWATLSKEQLTCGYLGDERMMAFMQTALRALEPREIGQPAVFTGAPPHIPTFYFGSGDTFRVALPPARIEQFVLACNLQNWIADPAYGIVLGGLDEFVTHDTVHKAVADSSGCVTFHNRDHFLAYEPASPGERDILRRLKRTFDPDGRLNPLPFT